MVIWETTAKNKSDEMCKTSDEQDCMNYELEKIPLLGKDWQLSSR